MKNKSKKPAFSNLGKRWHELKRKIYREFLALAEKCEHREPVIYNTNINGKHSFAWQCHKKKDPFDWGCSPTSCPLVGNAPFGMWDEIEPSAQEAYYQKGDR